MNNLTKIIQATTPVPRKNSKAAKLFLFVILIISVSIIIVAVSSLGNTLSHPTNQSSNQVKIEVSYNGEWNGAYGDTGSTVSWSGNGPYSTTMTKTDAYLWIVSANAQKQDDSTATLTISIVKMNGDVIKTASTSTAYGVAQVSATIDG